MPTKLWDSLQDCICRPPRLVSSNCDCASSAKSTPPPPSAALPPLMPEAARQYRDRSSLHPCFHMSTGFSMHRDDYSTEELLGGRRCKLTLEGKKFRRDDIVLVRRTPLTPALPLSSTRPLDVPALNC